MGNILCVIYNMVSNYLKQTYTPEEFLLVHNELTDILQQTFMPDTTKKVSSYAELQRVLSSINEKAGARKKKGVYYTPPDLVSFITLNTVKLLYNKLTPQNITHKDANIPKGCYIDFCFNRTIFDPTCGSGEFLLEIFSMKIDLLKKIKQTISTADIHDVIHTIYGNDINIESIKIAKIRLLLTVLNQFGVCSVRGLSKIMSQCFMHYDYILNTAENIDKYDILIGNPPYVEDSKCGFAVQPSYGNIYANVLENASQQLNANGVMGFVVPLSYAATPRMEQIRSVLYSQIPLQFILNYADRPDCLFVGVHQKLCLLFGKAAQCERTVFTSNYKYWYKEERPKLFTKCDVVKNTQLQRDFIPKVGNLCEIAILKKIFKQHDKIADLLNSGDTPVYLNMRATFWIKAFNNLHTGKEYKRFACANDTIAKYCMCLLNSSLFWWFWISTSDCWHITNKELNCFRCPTIFDAEVISLAEMLEEKLESTKKFVGTRQTEYEYKHKACISEIHKVDDYICELYGLSKAETEYIKNFAYTYRVSGGTAK